MPANFDADLDAMLGEPFGSPLTAAGQSDWGVLTLESEIVFGGDLIHVGPSVLANRSLFGSLGYGASLTIEGSTYQVEHQPITGGDGKLCRIPLKLLQVAPPTFQIFRLVAADTGQPLVTADTGQPLQTQPI